MNLEKLTLLIPAKYEKESLPIVLKSIENFNCKKLIVMSGDDLETIDSIKEFKCDVLLQKKSGYGNALIDGINFIKTEYLCIFNADGSFEEEDITKMRNKIFESNLDFVFASRYSGGGGSSDDTFLTYIGNKIFTLIGKIFFKLKVDDILYTFIFGLTDKFKKLNLTSLDFRLCVELPLKVKNLNMNYSNQESYEKSRIGGVKKVSEFRDGFLILLFLIKSFFKKY